MWFLSAARAELKFFNDPTDVPHPGICILSHTWGTLEEEQTFQQIQEIGKECKAAGENPRKSEKLSSKIRKCCELAEQHGYEWVWIDTCCIDKTSSAELSEAINSMFRYYSLSSVCYVYLSDVPSDYRLQALEAPDSFHKSRWHTRGWTLQELIAPQSLLFFSQDWTFLGTKADLASAVVYATGVPHALLCGKAHISSFSVAQRMSWAAKRQTSRKEDEAYCLLGIFDINMPTLYGEGANAFYRLQEEIIRKSPDTTIFAWSIDIENAFPVDLSREVRQWPLLADSPNDFRRCDGIAFGSGSVPARAKKVKKAHLSKDPMSFTLTPHGVLAHVPSVVIDGTRLIDLNWQVKRSYHYQPHSTGTRIYLGLALSESDDDGEALWHIPGEKSRSLAWYTLEPIEADWKMQDLYIIARSNGDRNPPRVLFPCNASAESPFHFRLSQSDGPRLTNVFSADFGRPYGTPAVIEIEQEGREFHLRFGVCARDACEDASKSFTRWITACFGLYEDCHTCQNRFHHSCEDDHIGDVDTWKDCSVEARLRWESLSKQDMLTGSFRLLLRRHPWADDTVIVEDIRDIMLQPSTKHPLTYALDPNTNRVLLHTNNLFPTNIAGPPIPADKGSVYLGSAVLDFVKTILPCHIALQDNTAKVFVTNSDGNVIQHHGYYYLLPFDEQRMHWISRDDPSLWGQCPVSGGWSGEYKMTHARTDECHEDIGHCMGYHVRLEDDHGAIVACNGKMIFVTSFDILCWKKERQALPSHQIRHIGGSADDDIKASIESVSLSRKSRFLPSITGLIQRKKP